MAARTKYIASRACLCKRGTRIDADAKRRFDSKVRSRAAGRGRRDESWAVPNAVTIRALYQRNPETFSMAERLLQPQISSCSGRLLVIGRPFAGLSCHSTVAQCARGVNHDVDEIAKHFARHFAETRWTERERNW